MDSFKERGCDSCIVKSWLERVANINIDKVNKETGELITILRSVEEGKSYGVENYINICGY